MIQYHINDVAWKKIFGFLKNYNGIYAQNEAAIRVFFEALYYISRTGCQWRLLPYFYGSWNSIFRRFRRWVERGIMTELFRLNS